MTGPLVVDGQDDRRRHRGPHRRPGDRSTRPWPPRSTPTISITLGYANTEAQVLQYAEAPLLSVVAPLEMNPQIIYWDPETYPRT